MDDFGGIAAAVRRTAMVGVAMACVVLVGPSALAGQEQPSAEEMAQANNPLASAYAVNLQNYFVPSLYDVSDESINTAWVRGVAPIGRTITRASLPLPTRPSGSGGSVSGLGDLNVFTAYLFVSDATTSLGVGPLLVVPTATDDALGQGKWQAGAAAVVFKATRIIQLGGLLTWQASFAGDSDRESTSLFAAQPFMVWQLGKGTYLRSTGIWGFDLKSGDYSVPIGFGVGQVLKAGDLVYNIFLEPQFTILHSGAGQPEVQLFAGINVQIPK